MDPLSALIGGAASIFGGFMNTSSQQSINAANLQQQMAIASGAQLPALVQNAKAAGLNPLAVLGQSAPGGMAAVGTNPGQGLMAAGRDIAQVDPRVEEMKNAQIEKAQVDVANARTLGNNAAIEGARNMWVLETLQAQHALHPDWPLEGIGQPTLPGMGADWLDRLNRGVQGVGSSISNVFSRVPQSMWNTP